jgi:hypothetical protein
LYSFFRFAFPALTLPAEISAAGAPKKLSELYPEETRNQLSEAYLAWKKENPLDGGFFAISFDSQVSLIVKHI